MNLGRTELIQYAAELEREIERLQGQRNGLLWLISACEAWRLILELIPDPEQIPEYHLANIEEARGMVCDVVGELYAIEDDC